MSFFQASTETEPLVNDFSDEDVTDNEEDVNNDSEEDEKDEYITEHPLANLDVDKLLVERLGEFGRYQQLTYLLVCLPAALTAGITLGAVFTEYEPRHRCFVPGCDDADAARYDDAFYFGFHNFTAAAGDAGCGMFRRVNNGTTCTAADFAPAEVEACDQFLFEDTIVKSSLVSEYGLVCSKNWEVPLSQSVFFAGVLVGAITFGWLSDVWGRKNTFLFSLMETTICGMAAAFSVDLDMFAVLQFFTAMGQVGLFQTTFVLGVELVGPSKRVLCGVVIEYFFVLGELYLAVTAWQLRQWRAIQLANLAPGLLFLSYYFFLPESVRWLVTKERYSQAYSTLQTVASRNKVQLPTQREMEAFKKQAEGGAEPSESLLDLLRRPRLSCRLVVVFLCWFVITMIYYGLSMNASSLAGDVYVNFALLSLCEVPGYTLSYLGMAWLGRRASLSSSLLVGGVACLVSSLAASHRTISTIFFLLGKFGATAAFGTVYLYTGELFPTRVRSVCVGLSSMVGRVGAIISPYVGQLAPLTGLSWAPMSVFAGAGILSGLLTLTLPETRGTALPRTLEEAENLGRSAATPLNNDQD